jgi:hypothetical protein
LSIDLEADERFGGSEANYICVQRLVPADGIVLPIGRNGDLGVAVFVSTAPTAIVSSYHEGQASRRSGLETRSPLQ